MLNFLENRIQKSLKKINKKTILTEQDLWEVIREIKLSLLEADVNLKVVKSFVNDLKEQVIGSEIVGKLNPSQHFIKLVRDELQTLLGSHTKIISLTKKPTIIMMVGLQGSGKTTTTAKLANYFLTKKEVQKPLLIAADSYRPAAVEQLIILGKMINVDVFAQKNSQQPTEIVKAGLKYGYENQNDLIIIDTAGRLAIDDLLMNEISEIKKISRPNEILFTTDAFAGQDIVNVGMSFHKQVVLTGIIITKLDSDARGGAAFSLIQLLHVPIRFIGTGEKIDNLDLFHPDRMAERILGMGDVLSLIEKAEATIDKKDAQHLTNRFNAGNFDLNDLLQQLEQVKKMGKISKLLKMIPGANKISPAQIESTTKKLELFRVIISSLTKEERTNPRLLKQPKRKMRIVKGSGKSNKDYNLLLSEFDRMKKQMKAMSKAMQSGTFNPGMMKGF